MRNPSPEEAFAWGSRSTINVRMSAAARDAARLIAVVVFPTPPFWFATAMIRAICCSTWNETLEQPKIREGMRENLSALRLAPFHVEHSQECAGQDWSSLKTQT